MRPQFDAIAIHRLGAAERLICYIQEGAKIGARIIRGCDANADGRGKRLLRRHMGGGFECGPHRSPNKTAWGLIAQ